MSALQMSFMQRYIKGFDTVNGRRGSFLASWLLAQDGYKLIMQSQINAGQELRIVP